MNPELSKMPDPCERSSITMETIGVKVIGGNFNSTGNFTVNITHPNPENLLTLDSFPPINQPTPYFTGRTFILDQLVKIFEAENTNENSTSTSNKSPYLVAVLTGMSGIGKSETAKRYCQLYKDNYDSNIAWINSESFDSLKASFQTMAGYLWPHNSRSALPLGHSRMEVIQLTRLIYSSLSKQGNKSLFIFDNAEGLDEIPGESFGIGPYLPNQAYQCPPTVLVTSTSSMWAQLTINIIKIQFGLSGSEAINLFQSYLVCNENANEPKVNTGNEITTKLFDQDSEIAIKGLAESLLNLPIGISMAAAFIQQKMLNMTKYQESNLSFKDCLLENIAVFQQDQISRQVDGVMINVWHRTHQRLECEPFGQEALKLLAHLVYFAPDHVTVRLCAQVISNPCFNQKDPLRGILGQEELKKIVKVLRLLHQYSILSMSREFESQESTEQEFAKVILHRMIRKCIKQQFLSNQNGTSYLFTLSHSFMARMEESDCLQFDYVRAHLNSFFISFKELNWPKNSLTICNFFAIRLAVEFNETQMLEQVYSAIVSKSMSLSMENQNDENISDEFNANKLTFIYIQIKEQKSNQLWPGIPIVHQFFEDKSEYLTKLPLKQLFSWIVDQLWKSNVKFESCENNEGMPKSSNLEYVGLLIVNKLLKKAQDVKFKKVAVEKYSKCLVVKNHSNWQTLYKNLIMNYGKRIKSVETLDTVLSGYVDAVKSHVKMYDWRRFYWPWDFMFNLIFTTEQVFSSFLRADGASMLVELLKYCGKNIGELLMDFTRFLGKLCPFTSSYRTKLLNRLYEVESFSKSFLEILLEIIPKLIGTKEGDQFIFERWNVLIEIICGVLHKISIYQPRLLWESENFLNSFKFALNTASKMFLKDPQCAISLLSLLYLHIEQTATSETNCSFIISKISNELSIFVKVIQNESEKSSFSLSLLRFWLSIRNENFEFFQLFERSFNILKPVIDRSEEINENENEAIKLAKALLSLRFDQHDQSNMTMIEQDDRFSWILSTNANEIPPGALVCGYDSGKDVLVARAYAHGDLIPGKFHWGQAYVPWDGKEHEVFVYQILVVRQTLVDWIECEGDEIVPNALRAGMTCSGEPLYIGRAYHCGSLTVGKVHLSEGGLFISYCGQEFKITKYQILVRKQSSLLLSHRLSKVDQDDPPLLNQENSVVEAIVTNCGDIFNEGYWVSAKDGYAPPGSLVGGWDGVNEVIVARASASIEGCLIPDLIPGKLIPNFKGAYVSWDQDEYFCREYQVLVVNPAHVNWIPSTFGRIISNAIRGSSSTSNLNESILNIGRVYHRNTLTVGKVDPRNKVMYIGYDGSEFGYTEYELLVLTNQRNT